MTTAPDVIAAIDDLIERADSEPMHLRKFYNRLVAIKHGLRACRNEDTIICMDPRCQRADRCQWKRGRK